MHKEGHIGLGLFAYAPIAFALALADATTLLGLGLVLIGFFSYAPDFDLNVPFLKHRGLTHTYLAALVAGIVSAVVIGALVSGTLTVTSLIEGPSILNLALIVAFGFVVGALGVLSHILGDVLTPMGVNPKQPFGGQNVTLDLVYASNERANEALSVLGMASFVIAIYLGISVV